MAQRNYAELAAGAVVLVVAIGFLGYAVAHNGRGGGGGYTLHAHFDSVGGLVAGADVRMSGVRIGTVQSTAIDPATFQAVVTFTVDRAIHLPKDSSAQISSSGLLGGQVLALAPGGDPTDIPPGGEVTITQGAVSLEDLLGKFIFNVGDLTDSVKKALNQGLPGAPAPK
jgi:phospholipid/cholesterol/gamma-HCH transport system substrate-binding protein